MSQVPRLDARCQVSIERRRWRLDWHGEHGHHDGGAAGRERAGGFEAEAGVGAGDDGDAVALIGNVGHGPGGVAHAGHGTAE